MLIRFAALAALVLLSACAAPGSNRASAIAEVSARENRFPDYPQPGMTYLSYSSAHGYQVNYLEAGRAWLWYPGNRAVVPERWRVIAGRAVCWSHPPGSHNPVTGQGGGNEACAPLEFSRKTIVAALKGDPFALRSGRVPYPLGRCEAPEAFGQSQPQGCR